MKKGLTLEKIFKLDKWLFFDNDFDNENENELIFNRRFVVPITLAGAIFSIASILSNGILNLNKTVQLIPYISFTVYIISFILLIFNKAINFIKYTILFFTLFLINFLWYYNNGVNGPVLYLFILLYSYLIFLLNDRQLTFFSIIISINIAILFYIEYYNPDIVSGYKTHRQQIFDVYLSTLFYGLLAFVMMYTAKLSYIKAYFGAKSADKLKTQFLENISHEIRTPLNAIIGFSNMLAENMVNKDQIDEYSKYIDESSASLNQLIKDILDISLIDSNQLTLKNEDVNITELFHHLYNKFNDQIISLNKNLKIELFIPRNEEIHILSDKGRLLQILNNLLDNAIKFTEHGTISFGFREWKNGICFFVKDTGIGFPAKVKEKIFERFYKLNDNKEKIFRGTGMGLFLSKSLVNKLGGEIYANSIEGKGSLFYFILPKKGFRKSNYKHHAKIFHENKKALQESEILIVEDDPTNQSYFKSLFSHLNFKNIYQAFDGDQAIEMIKSNPNINLVFMDIKMPKMDGLETLKEIKKLNNSLIVIAQTAFAFDKHKTLFLKAGFDAFIEKPVTKNELKKIFEKLGFEY